MAEKRREPFSVRYETRRPAAGLIYDDAPEPVRNGFLHVLLAVGSYLRDWTQVYSRFLEETDQWEASMFEDYELDYDVRGPRYLDKIADLVTACHWDHFYDLVQATAGLLRKWPDIQGDFENRFNEVLRRNYMGYELRDGQIERVGAREEEKSIAQARAILRDPELAGPDEQFQKAIGHFSRRPEPDLENCVKDAVGAVEGLARLLLDNPSILLSDAIKELGKRKGVHPALQKLVNGLYGYRSDVEGAAHGKTGKKAAATPEGAEFVLSTSAACIVYLARLYGRGVE